MYPYELYLLPRSFGLLLAKIVGTLRTGRKDWNLVLDKEKGLIGCPDEMKWDERLSFQV